MHNDRIKIIIKITPDTLIILTCNGNSSSKISGFSRDNFVASLVLESIKLSAPNILTIDFEIPYITAITLVGRVRHTRLAISSKDSCQD